jgi:titin
LAVSSNRVDLTWIDNSVGEEGFEVWASMDGGAWGIIGLAKRNSRVFRHSSFSGSHTFNYQVRAFADTANGDFSNTATAIVMAQPLGLNAQALNSSQIWIKWTDNATNETHYQIWRKVGSGDWTLLHTALADTPQYTDTVSANQTYTYQVRCTNGVHSSSYTNADTSPAMLGPTGLNGSAVSSTRVDLTWTDNSGSLAAGFQIFRRSGTGTRKMIGTVGPNVTTYSDLTAKPRTNYGYEVRASSGNDWSGFSNLKSITTP